MPPGHNYITALHIIKLLLLVVIVIILTLALLAERNYRACKYPTDVRNKVCPSDLRFNAGDGEYSQTFATLGSSYSANFGNQELRFPFTTNAGVSSTYPFYIDFTSSIPSAPTIGVSNFAGVSMGYEVNTTEGTSIFLSQLTNTTSWTNNFNSINKMLEHAFNDSYGISPFNTLEHSNGTLIYTTYKNYKYGANINVNVVGTSSVLADQALAINLAPAANIEKVNLSSVNSLLRATNNTVSWASVEKEKRTCMDPDFVSSVFCKGLQYNTKTALWSSTGADSITTVCTDSTINKGTFSQLNGADCGYPVCNPMIHPKLRNYEATQMNQLGQYVKKAPTKPEDFTYKNNPLTEQYTADARNNILVAPNLQSTLFCAGTQKNLNNFDDSSGTPAITDVPADKVTLKPQYALFPRATFLGNNKVRLGFN